MDLLIALHHGSLKDVEDVMKSQGIWCDYEALNTALANGNTKMAKFLLSQNCRVNKSIAADKFESTPLHKAVELKNVDLVKLLLESKASVTVVTEGGNTPLHLAFIAGLSEIVNVLIDHIGQSSEVVNCKNDFGLTHLQIACTTKNTKVIEKYLKTSVNIEDSVDMNSAKWAGYTALHFAVTYRSVCATKILSNFYRYHGKDKEKDNNGNTAWDLACMNLVEDSIIMEAMPSNHSRLSLQLDDKPSAFHLACMRGDFHLVKVFLDCGARVNRPVSKQMNLCPLYSPLHFAVESRCKEVVKLLLEYGAEVNSVNGYNMTALHLAMYVNDYGVMNLLYSKVADKEKNLMDDNQLSYFHIAVWRNDLDLVKKMLVDNQVDVNSHVLVNHRGFSLFTALHFAVQAEHHEMVKMLVEHGADLNVVSSQGTALQMAFERINWIDYGTFDLLLDLGAKIDVRIGQKTLLHHIILSAVQMEDDDRDETAIFSCYSPSFYNKIVRLIELGCDVNAKDENGDTALHLAHRSCICSNLLIEKNADVYIENDKGECPNLFAFYGRDPETKVLYDHVQNMMALGWKVHPNHKEDCELFLKELETKKERAASGSGFPIKLPWIQTGFKEEEEEECLREKHRDRLCEIKKMKNVKLDEKTTLYDFMRIEDKETGGYARNEVLKSIVEGRQEGFLLYEYLIKLQYRKSQKYAETKVTRKRTNEGSEENLQRKRAK